MALVAGIDLGSRFAKAVLVGADRQVVARAAVRTRPDFPAVAREVLDRALEAASADNGRVGYVVTTGFGRHNVPFRDIQVTEITSVAHGAAILVPEVRFILDIGFQSTRALRTDVGGRVAEFATNDKCAAGAGGFVERAARYLEVPLGELGQLSLRATNPQSISSICAVLAETEIINHLTAGVAVEDIVGGIHQSLADRAHALLRRVKLNGDVVFVGGMAGQAGMVRALEQVLGVRVHVADAPDFVGALGAALLGVRRSTEVLPAGGRT
jgi:predicted CoA-substrate-specific enzyme activase